MPSTDRRTVLVAVALCAAIGLMYAGTLSALARQWASDDNYSHGFFVLPLALYFAWERRATLSAASSQPGAGGLALILVSLLVRLIGVIGSDLFLTRVSLIGVIAGTIWFVWGMRHLRILAFPVFFLLLMIPLPAVVFNQLAFPLQLFASRVGETVIAAAGIPVLREGNVLHLPAAILEVAEACSGIRSLVSLVMLAIVLGYFTGQGTRGRALLAVAAIPIAIIANAARVAGTAISAELIGPEAAQGFFHTFSGWLMFVIAFAGLLAVQQGAARLGQRRGRLALARLA
jgi:exosortase